MDLRQYDLPMRDFFRALRRRAKWVLGGLLAALVWAAEQLIGDAFVDWTERLVSQPGFKSVAGVVLRWAAANPAGAVVVATSAIFVLIVILAYVKPVTAAQATAEIVATPRQSDRNLPLLVALPPRLAYLHMQENGGFTEFNGRGNPADVFVAALATFRNTPRSKGHDPHIESMSAHLVYESMRGAEVARVNHGMWVDEDYNSVSMNVGQTRELILVVWNQQKSALAVEDRREGADKYLELVARDLPSRSELVAKVELFVEDENGKQSYRNFKFRLKTHEPPTSL